jgi:hypothetical protein
LCFRRLIVLFHPLRVSSTLITSPSTRVGAASPGPSLNGTFPYKMKAMNSNRRLPLLSLMDPTNLNLTVGEKKFQEIVPLDWLDSHKGLWNQVDSIHWVLSQWDCLLGCWLIRSDLTERNLWVNQHLHSTMANTECPKSFGLLLNILEILL